MGVAAAVAPSRGIDMPKSRKEKPAVPPLTSSVQENFRGFTYHGESVVVPPAGVLAREAEEAAEAEEAVEEGADPDTDEEAESDSPAGRYARSRRRGEGEGEGDAFDGF